MVGADLMTQLHRHRVAASSVLSRHDHEGAANTNGT